MCNWNTLIGNRSTAGHKAEISLNGVLRLSPTGHFLLSPQNRRTPSEARPTTPCPTPSQPSDYIYTHCALPHPAFTQLTPIRHELIPNAKLAAKRSPRKPKKSNTMSTTTTTKLLPRPLTSTRTLALSRRHSSTHAHLAHSLPARRLPPIYSDLTPSQSHALGITLSAFLPPSWTASSATTALPANAVGAPVLPQPSAALPLPPAHHLVYFNPVIPADRLLHDGTDPLQSPGAPFVRRMWAGGYVKFARGEGPVLDGARWVCVEGIRDVAVKGRAGEEKVFVGIERRVGRAAVGGDEGEEAVRARLWAEAEADWGDAELIERRNIVFMRGRTAEEAGAEVERARGKMLFRMFFSFLPSWGM